MADAMTGSSSTGCGISKYDSVISDRCIKALNRGAGQHHNAVSRHKVMPVSRPGARIRDHFPADRPKVDPANVDFFSRRDKVARSRVMTRASSRFA